MSRQRRKMGRRILVMMAVIITQITVIGGIATYYQLQEWRADLPELEGEREIATTSKLYTESGQEVGSFATEEDRRAVSLAQIGPWLRHGVVLIEDKRFYEHDGYDIKGVVRAAYVNARGGSQGGSTITQQLVRDLYEQVGRERTYTRKLKEAHYAAEYEAKLRKRYGSKKVAKAAILEKYLNTVYFGSGAYGIEAATLRYYNLRARQLNIGQAAYLVGLIQSPGLYTENKAKGRWRQRVVLNEWLRQGLINQGQYDNAVKVPLPESKPAPNDALGGLWTGLSRIVLDEVSPRYPNVKTGGYAISTTLRMRTQHQALKALKWNLQEHNGKDNRRNPLMGSIVVAENKTGAIRAVAQYPPTGWFDSTMIRRQPGSSAKIWPLASAVQNHYDIEALRYNSMPLNITLETGEVWKPKTYTGTYSGVMDMRRATIASDNSVFAQFTLDLGPERVARTAQESGINRRLPAVASIGLGSVAVTPREQTNFYTTLARGGNYIPLHSVSSLDRNCRRLFEVSRQGQHVYDKAGASLILSYLHDNVSRGTGTRAALSGFWSAGKTGTTDDYKDAWYCGITVRYTACVWVGYKKPKEMSLPGWGRVTGGSLPAKIWHDAMTQILPEADRGKRPDWETLWQRDDRWIERDLIKKRHSQ